LRTSTVPFVSLMLTIFRSHLILHNDLLSQHLLSPLPKSRHRGPRPQKLEPADIRSLRSLKIPKLQCSPIQACSEGAEEIVFQESPRSSSNVCYSLSRIGEAGEEKFFHWEGGLGPQVEVDARGCHSAEQIGIA
jgi:hypothetical protein